jgi:hypothetical protein
MSIQRSGTLSIWKTIMICVVVCFLYDWMIRILEDRKG